MSIEVQMAQRNFLRDGGVLQKAIMEKYKSGEWNADQPYHEYPKDVRINEREEEVEHVTEDIRGRVLRTTSVKKVWDTVTVHSAEEEDRVLSGGKPAAEIEQERQDLMQRCRNMGLRADPEWSIVRLKRELGEAMDAPEPKDEMSELKAQLEKLQEMAAMKARIAELEAQLADDDLPAQLAAAGVKVDRRWSRARMQEELDRVQASD